MRQKKAISDAVIERLPLYYRDLLLLQDAGIDIISSEKLGERLGITPEQIRKDLTCFGAFGKKASVIMSVNCVNRSWKSSVCSSIGKSASPASAIWAGPWRTTRPSVVWVSGRQGSSMSIIALSAKTSAVSKSRRFLKWGTSSVAKASRSVSLRRRQPLPSRWPIKWSMPVSAVFCLSHRSD